MARKGENIFKRKDGRWEARYIHHYDADGRAVYRFVYARGYTEAKEKRRLAMNTPDARVLTCENPDMNIEYLCDKWLFDIKMSVKESTYARYLRVVKKYIVPELGKTPLEEIDARKINAFSQKLQTSGGCYGGLSGKTVTDILVILKSILKFGAADGDAIGNTEGVKYPSRDAKKIRIIDEASRGMLERCLINSKSRIALGILTSLYTGVRIGELCGLRWRDIDFVNGSITVQRTVERISEIDPLSDKRTKVIICEPKTKSSVRTIPLPPFLLETLGRVFCEDEKNAAFAEDLYILSRSETPAEPHNVYNSYKRFMRKNGIDDYSFHALRHTFATRCVEVGFDAKSLSEILGHANVSTTLSIYVHPTLAQKRSQMERLIPSWLEVAKGDAIAAE